MGDFAGLDKLGFKDLLFLTPEGSKADTNLAELIF